MLIPEINPLDILSELVLLHTINYMELTDAVNFVEITDQEDCECKYISKIFISDEVKESINDDELATQWQYSVQGVARGIAHALDYAILSTIMLQPVDPKYDTVAAVEWDRDSADIFGDIQRTVDELPTDHDLLVYYPLRLFRALHTMTHAPDDELRAMEFAIKDPQYAVKFIGTTKLNNRHLAIVLKEKFASLYYIMTCEKSYNAKEKGDEYILTLYYTFKYIKPSVNVIQKVIVDRNGNEGI